LILAISALLETASGQKTVPVPNLSTLLPLDVV